MHGGGWEPETPERDNARKHGCVQSRASHRALAARVLRACARIAIRGRRHTRQLRRCRRSFVDLRRDSVRPQCRCHLRMRAAAVRAAAAASDARARGVHACVAPGRSCRRPRCRQHVGQEASPRSILCARAGRLSRNQPVGKRRLERVGLRVLEVARPYQARCARRQRRAR